MTVRDVVRSLQRFWPLALGVLLLFVAIGLCASLLPAERYKASTLVFVEPANQRALEFGARESLDLLMPTIAQQVKTRRFYESVSRSSTRDLGDTTLTAQSEPGTGVLTITAESADPEVAAAAANAAAEELRLRRLSTAVQLSVLDPAVPPDKPSSPRKVPIMFACVVLGAIAAVFAVLAANALRRRVASADSVRRSFGLTVIGEIRRTRKLQHRPSALFKEGGPAETIEEYQRLRTNFELLSRRYHTVAVTSWAQGEGKTTVVSNLGWMLASLGRQVTVVDLDLRHPSIHTPFGVDLRGGVADLARGADYESIVKATRLPALDVLTAGVLADQPAKAIEDAFPAIQAIPRERLVLIDTPPLLAAETAMIASLVDALVVVIDVRRRDPAELEALLQVLKLTNARILGVVLNRVRGGVRGRHISDYYSAAHGFDSTEPLQEVREPRR